MNKKVIALSELVNELLESLDGYGVDEDTMKYFETKLDNILSER